MGHLGIELRYQTLQPINAVKDLDALRMRIVSDLEWSTHGSHLQEKSRFVKLVIKHDDRQRLRKTKTFEDRNIEKRLSVSIIFALK